jgi:hypothetical protein
MFALGSFKALISSSQEDSVARAQLEAERLSTAALLVRVATVDSDMSEVNPGHGIRGKDRAR